MIARRRSRGTQRPRVDTGIGSSKRAKRREAQRSPKHQRRKPPRVRGPHDAVGTRRRNVLVADIGRTHLRPQRSSSKRGEVERSSFGWAHFAGLDRAGDEGRGDRVRETFAGGRTFADESTAARNTLRGRHEVRRPGCVQASSSLTGGARNAAAWRSRVTSSERVARRRRSRRSPVGRSRRGGPRGRDGGRQRRGSVRERLLQQLRGGSAPRCGGESR